MPQVKALLFDVFGTVVDWRSGIAGAMDAFLARHAPALAESEDPAQLADAWRARYQPAMQAVRAGQRPFVRLDVLHRENLALVLRGLGLDPSRLPPGAVEELNLAWHRLDPWPDAVEGLARLRQDYLVAPLSNGNIALIAHMAKRAGLPWDCILGAEVTQAYKPMPEAYLRAADILGLEPGECMLVAAHNGDLHAAQSVGFATAFVPRPAEHGPRQRTDLVAAGHWTFVARDFLDLADQLAGAADEGLPRGEAVPPPAGAVVPPALAMSTGAPPGYPKAGGAAGGPARADATGMNDPAGGATGKAASKPFPEPAGAPGRGALAPGATPAPLAKAALQPTPPMPADVSLASTLAGAPAPPPEAGRPIAQGLGKTPRSQAAPPFLAAEDA